MTFSQKPVLTGERAVLRPFTEYDATASWTGRAVSWWVRPCSM